MMKLLSALLLLLGLFIQPISVRAEDSNVFTVTDYKTFYVYTNPTPYPQGSAYGASGYALNLGDKVEEIESITSVTLTYNSCTWEIFGGCWGWEYNKSLTVNSDQFMGLYHTINTPSTLPLVGPIDTLLSYKSDVAAYSNIYGVPNAQTRSELASYDYYFVLDGEWVVTEVLLIKITYISKTTQEEVESICTTGCELGDTWDNMPSIDWESLLGSGDILQGILVGAAVLLLIMAMTIVIMFLANLKFILDAIKWVVITLFKLPGMLFAVLKALFKFLYKLPGRVLEAVITIFVALRSIVLFTWKVITMLWKVIVAIVRFIYQAIVAIVTLPFRLFKGAAKYRRKVKYGRK